MAEIDKDTLDYLRSNLEREVRENVESRLFRFWIALAAAFLGGVGLVGVPWSLAYIDGKISRAVEAKVQDATVEPTEKAKRLAEEAQDIAQQARDEVRKALTEIDARRTIAEEELVNMRAQAGRVNEQITTLRTQVTESYQTARDRLAEIEDRSNQLSDRVRNAVPDAGQIASMVHDFQALVEEVARIDGQLAQVVEQTGTPPVPDEADALKGEQLVQLEQSSNQRVMQAQVSAPSSTVYMQFAQLTRENAKAISAQLLDAGWKVPGEERLDSAAGLHEIRCYYEEDCSAAERLKADTEAALTRLGFSPQEIAIRKLLTYTPKPRQGVLEIWLGMENPPKA
jgi:hypothetical protein